MAVRRESKKKGAGKPAVATEEGAQASPSAPAVELPLPADAPEPALPPTATGAIDHSAEERVLDTRPQAEERVISTRPQAARVAASSYTVVARRYRPQRFEDVVGQDHVVHALRNAIRLNRIAQAYLFCGTRGVGKTSIARIFAKCLNCVKGPTESPCQTCDICQAIATGQDVDVIEIDGASNNGVEQVRELRQNAGLRPSRSRYKIYYIDEVHMLSTGAFNALLKTLEEPPAHVKFLFATTEPSKIPITVLSRCQRYDFAGISSEAIAATLGEICTREGTESEPEALQLVARRAGGSLRDAQSLLDRLLASGRSKLTVEVVHSLLGTASDERLLTLLEALAGHDPGTALGLLEQSASEGVQPNELLSGLIDLGRDAMILAAGGAESLLMAISPRNRGQLKSIVERWTVQPIMAAMQILSECRGRMRGSVHGRILLETALVRTALLEDMTSLTSLVERLAALESGGVPPRRAEPGSVKTKPSARAAHTTPAPEADGTPFDRAHAGRSVPATSEARATPMAAPAPEADGTPFDRAHDGRSVPATSEAQATPMAAPAPAAAEPPPRGAMAEPLAARAESKQGEGESKLDAGAAIPVRSGATPAPRLEEPTRPIVPARTESPAGDGAHGDAFVRVPPAHSGVSAAAVAEAPAAPGGREVSGRAAVEPATAVDGAAGGESVAAATVAAHRGEPGPLDLEAVRKLWPELAKKVDKRLALTLTQVEPIELEGADVLVIAAKPGYNSTFADVDSPEAQFKIAQALQRLVHRPVKIKYVRRFVDEHGDGGARRNEARRADSLSKDPMVQRVLELFEARPVQMDYDEDGASQED